MVRRVDVWGPRRRVLMAPFAGTLLAALVAWLGEAAGLSGPAVVAGAAILVLAGGVAGTGTPPARRLSSIPRALLGLLGGCAVVLLAVVATTPSQPADQDGLLGILVGPLVLAILLAAPVLGGFILLPPLAEAVGVGAWWRDVPDDVEARAAGRPAGTAFAGTGVARSAADIRVSVAGVESTRYATVNLGLVYVAGTLVAGVIALASGGSSGLLTGLVILVAWSLLTGMLAARRVPARTGGGIAVTLLACAALAPLVELRRSGSVTWSAAVGIAFGVAAATLAAGYVVGRALWPMGRVAPGDSLAAVSGRRRRLSAELAGATERGTADVVLRVYRAGDGPLPSAADIRTLGPLGYRVARELTGPTEHGRPPPFRLALFVRGAVDASEVADDAALIALAGEALDAVAQGDHA